MVFDFFTKRLSNKLLLITFAFIMLAEALIFIPSAAMFRQNWLEERAQSAGLLTLAIEGVPDFAGGEMLAHRFMQDSSVTMVRQKRMGRSQLVLGQTPAGARIITTDLRKKQSLMRFRETFRDFFSGGKAYIRILAAPTVKDAELLEIMVPQQAVKTALLDYSRRILLWSLALSFITGLLLYIALARLIVRPLKKLAFGLEAFRKDPRKLQSRREMQNGTPKRKDEIGQLESEFIAMKTGIRRALKQQERLATLGMAMAKINHDLRNVLSSAGLVSERLAMEKDDRIKAMGERLVRSVERGVKLCEATLSFSQSVEEKPELKNFQIAKLADEAADNVMAELGNTDFKNHIPPDLTIYADPDYSYRILHNLIKNAVQAMQGAKPARLEIKTKTTEDKALIYIIDSGPGIADKARQDLFKAFTSVSKKGGTGLGLTISRELARAQGGNLVLSETGKTGTVFILSLPLAKTKGKINEIL